MKMPTFQSSFSAVVACVLLCCSCGNKKSKFTDDPVFKSGDEERSVRVDPPGMIPRASIPVKGSSSIIIPLAGTETRNKNPESEEPLYYYHQSPVWNLLFYDMRTKKSRLVDEKGFFEVNKVVMPCDSASLAESYQSFSSSFYDRSPFPFILFEALPERYGHDTLQEEKRPFIRSLYKCDLSGNNLYRLSPPGFLLEAWRVVDSVNFVIEMMGEWDMDGDKVFENAERGQIMYAHLKEENPLSILIPDSLNRELYKKYTPYRQVWGWDRLEK